ncbi:unnamed protein product [Effrenium voratum]|uniref:Cryptochrome DASH n=1 Tax=Effrenium voratum TaxID=2562239 RepID=A0AA36J1K7_9DINO|nr:unnamed protein product [Effrenium voratum]
MAERSVLLDGCSKAFAMTGWRLGFGLFPAELVEPARNLAINSWTCVPPFVAAAAVTALQSPEADFEYMRLEYAARRDLVFERLANLKGFSIAVRPAGAMYLLANVTGTGLSSRDFAEKLLEEEGVALLDGKYFGAAGDGLVRISFAQSREILAEGCASWRVSGDAPSRSASRGSSFGCLNEFHVSERVLAEQEKKLQACWVAAPDPEIVLKLPVLVVYVLDEGQLRTGKFRAKFLLQSLAACKANLQLVGSDLLIRLGRPEEVLPRLLAEGSVLVTQEEPTFEEQATDRALQTGLAVAENMRWEYVWGATLIHKDDLPFQADLKDMPDVFTAFKNQVAPELKCACNQVPPDYRDAPKAETALNIRRCLAPLGFGSLPLPALDFGFLPCWSDLSFGESESEPELPFGIAGGESAGQRRLEEFMGSPMARYAESKNNMLALDASSKLSPWLANGSLSPRRVFEALRRREAEISADAATYWFTFALLVRDFFHFMAKKQGRRIFLEGGVIGKRLAWKGGDREFQLWQQGQTGFPLVDANMREMATTGWMSNRGRQNVASFLIWDLQVDWRRGADWFERCLLDYDVASNWCNWVAAAELTGGRVNRFNVVKQSRQYDPEGEYLRRWLPELRELPAEWIHEPWRREGSKLSAYPPPCVPLEAPKDSEWEPGIQIRPHGS